MESTPNVQNANENKCAHKRCSRWRFLFPLKIALFVVVKSGIVMLLWNLLVPETFHGPELNFVQAIELTVLAKLLVGFGGGRRHPMHRGPMGHGGFRRWRHLTPEQREELKQKFQK